MGWSTRENQPGQTGIAIIQQRTAQDDLSGHVWDEFEHLKIPFRYDGSTLIPHQVGMKDPRKKEGEFYWYERFDEKFYEKAKRRLGSYGIAAQLQQNPSPMGGGMIKIPWFFRYEAPIDMGTFEFVFQSWDTAQKGEELIHCPWVGITWGVAGKKLYVLDVYRDFHEYPEGRKMVKAIANRYTPNVVVIEDKSSGSSLIQDLNRDNTFRYPVYPFEPERDKITRLGVESPKVEAGEVGLPNQAPWLAEFEMELKLFPASEFMDQADGFSMGLNYARHRAGLGDDDFPEDGDPWPDDDEDEWE